MADPVVGVRAPGVALLLLLAAAAAASAAGLTLEEVLAADWDTLEVRVVTRMPEDRRGGRAVVLLHGYGSRSAEWVPMAQAILDDETRVFLPTAPLPFPGGRGAMWWEFLEDDWPKPWPVHPDAKGVPKPSLQLPKARASVERLVAGIRERFAPDQVVLVGHSQGAMLALDVGVAADPPVDAIAAISGYVLVDSVARIEAPRTPRPTVLIVHGRKDELVGFEAAEAMKGLLEKNGYPVVFEPHGGGHGIDDTVVWDVRVFLETLAAPPEPKAASEAG